MHLEGMHRPHHHLEGMHRHHHHPRLTEAQDEALVAAVGQFPALYDLRHEDYKNRKVRADLWDNIALSLGRDGKITNAMYNTLYHSYNSNN